MPASRASSPRRIAVNGVALAGLRTQRVAGRERGRHLPGGHHERVIPRDDGAHHADRLAQRVGHDRRVHDMGPAVQMLRGTGEQLERGDRDLDLGRALPLGLAIVAALELSEIVSPLVEQLCQPVQRPRTLRRGRLGPGAVERATCRGHGGVDVIGPALRNARDLSATGRVEGGERRA